MSCVVLCVLCCVVVLHEDRVNDDDMVRVLQIKCRLHGCSSSTIVAKFSISA
jgi:hypothetical protein